jgi:hypothetical protein
MLEVTNSLPPKSQIGDHIEKIDGENLVGWRHVDVAKHLKGIPVGRTFTIRLIEPLRAGFGELSITLPLNPY